MSFVWDPFWCGQCTIVALKLPSRYFIQPRYLDWYTAVDDKPENSIRKWWECHQPTSFQFEVVEKHLFNMMKDMVNDIQICVENVRHRDPDFDSNWDPMRDDYENVQLNAYDHGPGANLDVSLQRPAYRNAKNEVVYKIMINRIPHGLTQIGLENIFLNCGSPKVSKCYKENADRIIWALVEFKTLQEAERAILMLDNQPPLNMKVSFARSDEENERLKKKREEEEKIAQKWAMEYASNSSSFTPNQLPGSSRLIPKGGLGRGTRGKFILNAYRQNCERGSGLKNCVWSNGVPDFRDPGGLMYNPHSNRHDASNKYMQGFVVTTTGKNSVRRVVMGRGFVPPQSGEASLSSDCEVVLEKTVGSDVMVPLLPCRKCSSETTQKCSMCGTPYCSRKCQRDDYGRHKPECATKQSIDYPVDASSKETLKFVPMCKPLEPVIKMESEPTPTNSHWDGLNSVVGLLGEGTQAVFEIKSEDSGQFHGTLSCHEVLEVADKLLCLGHILQQSVLDLSFWPAPGTMVAVKYEGSVCRATILFTPIIGDSTVFKVALCDYAKIEDIQAENIFRLASDISGLPELAVTCDVLQSSPQLTAVLCQERSLDLKVEGPSNSKVTAQVVNNNNEVIGVVSISPWVPSKQWLIPVQLVPPCQVIITAYHNQNAVYVRPVGRNYQEQMFTVLQMVAAVVATSPPLDRAPHQGEMVACFYKNDGNYYRAIVQECTAEGYSVFFVDFGDICMASIQSMKFLPWEIKVKPCMAVKVSLKGVTQGPLTDDAVQYLNMLLRKEQQLRLECSKPDTDGVELFNCSDNKSVNAQIQELLTPEWKSFMKSGEDPHKGQVFMLEDTKVLPLIKGGLKSGFTNVWVTSVMPTGRVAVCPVDQDHPEVVHVLETLSFQINEYCESTDQNSSYNPRENEVCLVKFKDGLWHRAVNSMTFGATQTCQVLFLDFGNVETVPFTNIRRILPDFVHAHTLTSICQLDGIPAEPPVEMIEKVIEKVPANKQYEVEVVEEIGKGEYKIRIPELFHELKSLFSEVS